MSKLKKTKKKTNLLIFLNNRKNDSQIVHEDFMKGKKLINDCRLKLENYKMEIKKVWLQIFMIFHSNNSFIFRLASIKVLKLSIKI